LPTPEEAYNFCMQVWESDSETEKKKAKEKPAADAETQEEEPATSAADAAQPDETADDNVEV